MLHHAIADDIPLIQSILNRPDNLDKLEGYSDDALRAALTRDRIFTWVEGGDCLGFCWVTDTPNGPKIEEFGTRAPGGGVGSKLFRAVLDQLDPSGLWLAVAADNAAAIRFYHRFGFVPDGLRPAAWHRRKGPPADALILRYDAWD